RFWSHQREFARPAARRDLHSSHQAIKPGFRRALLPPARTTFDLAPTDEDKIRFCPRPGESAPALAAADGHPPRQVGATGMASNPGERSSSANAWAGFGSLNAPTCTRKGAVDVTKASKPWARSRSATASARARSEEAPAWTRHSPPVEPVDADVAPVAD